MSATATPTPTPIPTSGHSDRSDFRTVTVGGAKLGAATAVAVVLFLATSRLVPGTGGARSGVEALIVLVTGLAASFLPAQWTVARTGDGIAGAAALGLVGTLVFSVIDIAVLRPFKAYPWTWDAIGGGSTWWYLSVWWMLGTFAAWMGAMITAAQAARGEATLVRTALPTVATTVIVVALARIAGLPTVLPVATGAGLALVLAAFALVALARKG